MMMMVQNEKVTLVGACSRIREGNIKEPVNEATLGKSQPENGAPIGT